MAHKADFKHVKRVGTHFLDGETLKMVRSGLLANTIKPKDARNIISDPADRAENMHDWETFFAVG